MKTNYLEIYKQEIDYVKTLDKKPSLLLHSCCGVCGGSVFEKLIQYFDVTVYFYNPNIHPKQEYIRRRDELIDFLDRFNIENKSSIKFIEGAYEPEPYIKQLKPFKDDREGQNRCGICYALRIVETFEFANANNFDYCTTILTVSRHKDSQKLNRIAIAMQPRYTVKYLLSDFKKEEGTKRSQQIASEYHLYKQNYCGCVYSKVNMLKKFKLKEENNHESTH